MLIGSGTDMDNVTNAAIGDFGYIGRRGWADQNENRKGVAIPERDGSGERIG